jgi:hypothetical protein
MEKWQRKLAKRFDYIKSIDRAIAEVIDGDVTDECQGIHKETCGQLSSGVEAGCGFPNGSNDGNKP